MHYEMRQGIIVLGYILALPFAKIQKKYFCSKYFTDYFSIAPQPVPQKQSAATPFIDKECGCSHGKITSHRSIIVWVVGGLPNFPP